MGRSQRREELIFRRILYYTHIAVGLDLLSRLGFGCGAFFPLSGYYKIYVYC